MYKVIGWDKLQHFKNRRPPWIKLYRDILDDRQIHGLSDKAFRVLIQLWLLASEDEQLEGNLPSAEDIAFRLRMPPKEIIKIIQELNGLISTRYQDDINLSSERYQDDTPEREGEGEGETEGEYMLGKSKKFDEDAKELLSFLNQKTGRNYQPVKANLDIIKARLKEGYTPTDLRKVIAKKYREWSPDEKMSEYLRPATLFNRTKCAQYVGELVLPREEPQHEPLS